jgi:5-methylcytosine-specific restriction endonuclease McrA
MKQQLFIKKKTPSYQIEVLENIKEVLKLKKRSHREVLTICEEILKYGKSNKEIIKEHNLTKGIRAYQYIIKKSTMGEYSFSNIKKYYYLDNPEKLIKKIRKGTRTKNNIIGLKLRYEILERDNFRCITCGATPKKEKLHIDHIIPYSKGGKTTKNNLRCLCERCNIGKGDLI